MYIIPVNPVMFKWNVLLNLSGGAVTNVKVLQDLGMLDVSVEL